ncbi:hypothetical protein [Actinophytocola oryzae]|uniref:Fibronectin type-III domain-containing protein n=1 Tax=Actinophytocola oryzae TaxID=502181 RepID=A0A4R7VCN3_9PSEU|nr:hypothetical protein [Actinophytocola oryzae]TDV46862.1 hypothetical protein CLV71_11042 [Actinophytocola oryzae]
MTSHRWSRRWKVLVVPVLMVGLAVVPAQASATTARTTGSTASQQSEPRPSTPQNLRGDYRDGVLESISWDASTMPDLEYSIWYDIHLHESNGASHLTMSFPTTVTIRELLDSLYLEPGHTYTIWIVAWGHSAGKNRSSDASAPLSVTFPDA